MRPQILLLAFVVISCGQNNTEKAKNEVSQGETVSKKEKSLQTDSSLKITAEDTKRLITVTYNFENHNDIKGFWKDFQIALQTEDKDAINKMIKFPFKDYEADAWGDKYSGIDLTCTGQAQLDLKFNIIFSKECLTKEDPVYIGDEFITGDYFIPRSENKKCHLPNGYLVKKIKGVYKLVGLSAS